jgi:hypothetical protein
MPTLRRLDRRRVTAAAAACATSSPPARCKRSARFSPVTHDQRPAHCARSLLSPPTPTAFDPDRIGSWKAASLRHQHRRGSNRPGGGGKPGRETDHNRPELELGRTLPPVDGRVKRDGGEIFGAVGRREGEDDGRPRRSPQTGKGTPSGRSASTGGSDAPRIVGPPVALARWPPPPPPEPPREAPAASDTRGFGGSTSRRRWSSARGHPGCGHSPPRGSRGGQPPGRCLVARVDRLRAVDNLAITALPKHPRRRDGRPHHVARSESERGRFAAPHADWVG